MLGALISIYTASKSVVEDSGQYSDYLLLLSGVKQGAPPSGLLYIAFTVGLIDVFNTTIRNSRKCFSKWKDIDVQEVKGEDKYEVIGYLNKETNSSHLSFDPYNSILPVPT